MSKAEKTRAFIIEKSTLVFNTKGYSGTSINDLITATGLTKGSIYGNFKDKNAVALAVYQNSITALDKKIAELLDTKNSSVEKLIGYTEFYRQNWNIISEKGGCPIQNAAIEADDNNKFLKKHVQISVKNWAGNLSKIIEQGKKSGEIKKAIIAENYAYTIISMIEGGIMLAKIMDKPNLLFEALDRIKVIINTEIKKH